MDYLRTLSVHFNINKTVNVEHYLIQVSRQQ